MVGNRQFLSWEEILVLASAAWYGVLINTDQKAPSYPSDEVLFTWLRFQSGNWTNSLRPLSYCFVMWELLDYYHSLMLPGNSRKQPGTNGLWGGWHRLLRDQVQKKPWRKYVGDCNLLFCLFFLLNCISSSPMEKGWQQKGTRCLFQITEQRAESQVQMTC